MSTEKANSEDHGNKFATGQTRSNASISPKKQTFSWIAFIVANIVAVFLIAFISAAVGIKPQGNITWTVFWIYLSIEAWKSWRWKALLPYPLFLVLTIIFQAVVAATGSNYLSWTHISVLLFLNIGGLVIFYLLLRKTQNNQKIDAAQNRTKTDKQWVADTESDFNKPIGNTIPGKITVQKPSSQSNNESSKVKGGNDITVNEDELYEQIWKEIEDNKTDIGLWAKCFSTCEGDENKTKALYVSKRVFVLKQDLQNQLIDQEIEAKKEMSKRMLIFEGRTDDIEVFSKTLKTMPNFFPKLLNQFGYKLVHSKDKEELWSIYFPNGIGVRSVYNLYDLRTEIRKIVENNPMIIEEPKT